MWYQNQRAEKHFLAFEIQEVASRHSLKSSLHTTENKSATRKECGCQGRARRLLFLLDSAIPTVPVSARSQTTCVPGMTMDEWLSSSSVKWDHSPKELLWEINEATYKHSGFCDSHHLFPLSFHQRPGCLLRSLWNHFLLCPLLLENVPLSSGS